MMLSRRQALASAGALVVSFTMLPHSKGQSKVAQRGSLAKAPYLDSWIAIDRRGQVTVFCGKAELGQGIGTAVLQVASEELEVDLSRIRLQMADTALTPDEGFTAGSRSASDSATAVMNACAFARALLVRAAAGMLGVATGDLRIASGIITAQDGRSLTFGDVAGELALHVPVDPAVTLKDPRQYGKIGKSVERVDIPDMLKGVPSFIQDLRLDGMVHVRVVRPPSERSKLQSVQIERAKAVEGVLDVLRVGDWLAVAAKQEWQAILGARSLSTDAVWSADPQQFVEPSVAALKAAPAQTQLVIGHEDSTVESSGQYRATYFRPCLMHGSIGPSCALALFKDGSLTVWTHSQGVSFLRSAIAQLMGMPLESVRCIHVHGSGCYGHNGADDAAGDAAMAARALPERAVRVQWMRDDEHGWEPLGPAMAVEVHAEVNPQGRIVGWRQEIWSHTHMARPLSGAMLLQNAALPSPLPRPPVMDIPMPEGGGQRNSVPGYDFGRMNVRYNLLTGPGVRTSALRALGAHLNVVAIEGLVDEIAEASNQDPVEFRLKHLEDPRARAVVQRAASVFGWQSSRRRRPGLGRGFAYARYKNMSGYCAVAADLSVDRKTGAVRLGRFVVAVDVGQVISPDGVRNQVEGGVIQSASWTLLEQVRFENGRVSSRDWASYPILRFQDLPSAIEVDLINQPGAPFLGAGEVVQGPAAAAIANALSQAVGARVRETPFTAQRVLAAMTRRA